jgi:hypothetical protein
VFISLHESFTRLSDFTCHLGYTARKKERERERERKDGRKEGRKEGKERREKLLVGHIHSKHTHLFNPATSILGIYPRERHICSLRHLL